MKMLVRSLWQWYLSVQEDSTHFSGKDRFCLGEIRQFFGFFRTNLYFSDIVEEIGLSPDEKYD
jgi:hypothetical protein